MICGALVGRISLTWLVIVGSIGSAVSAVVFAATDPRSGFAKSMLWVLLFNAWPDVFYSGSQMYACAVVGPRHAALAGSLFALTVRLSMSLGLAITSAISTSTIKEAVAKGVDLHDAQLSGYHAAGWFCFSTSTLGIIFTLLFLRKIGVVGSSQSLSSQSARDEQTTAERTRRGSAHGSLRRMDDIALERMASKKTTASAK